MRLTDFFKLLTLDGHMEETFCTLLPQKCSEALKIKYGADDYLLWNLHSWFVRFVFFFVVLSAVVETCQKFQFFNRLVVSFRVGCDKD